MSSDADGCAAIVAAIALTCAIAFGGWRFWGFDNGLKVGRNEMQKEAVEAGHAEYVITDPATGATEFRWKEGK